MLIHLHNGNQLAQRAFKRAEVFIENCIDAVEQIEQLALVSKRGTELAAWIAGAVDIFVMLQNRFGDVAIDTGYFFDDVETYNRV